jgi:formylglycine-generating enzyme required for sulfatase activity
MHGLAILLVVLAGMLFSSTCHAQQRFALLIGNQAYMDAVGPLKNPYNDVARVGRALEEVGFTVLDPIKDATRDDMLFGVYKLADRLRKAGPGAVGFLYYTGHGIAVGGENVLIPKNVESTSDAELNVRGVRLGEVLDILKTNAPQAVHFVVLDACRNNIRGQKGAKGFVPVSDQRAGVVLAFATAAGETASDEGAGSGPYAAALAQEIVIPGRNDQAVFNAVRSRVVTATARHQTPWTHDGLIGERIVFKAIEPSRPAATELTYKQYIEAFEAQRPILKGTLFPREAFGDLAYSVLERSIAQFKGKVWDGGDDWGRIAFDATGRMAKYFEPSGREAGELLIQGVMSDSGHTLGGVRGVQRSAELVGEWHQSDGKGEGGFILKSRNEEVTMSWGPLFRRESRWRASVSSALPTPGMALSEAAEAWSATKDTTSTGVLEAYIARYKDTFYAELARARIEELKKQHVASADPLSKPAMAGSKPLRCNEIETAVANERQCLKPKDTFKDCPSCPLMVVIPSGEFAMGSPTTEEAREGTEAPQHKVKIPKPLAVGRFAVTFGEFATFVQETNYAVGDSCWSYDNEKWQERAARSFRNPGFAQSDRHPVVCVSWEDAKAFAGWLSKTTGKNYRLLTEAEREYVARAGTATPFWWGASISAAQANYDSTFAYAQGSKGERSKGTVRVDTFTPNPWGLYSAHGNVWEWVEDCWHENYDGAPGDGSAWISGDCSRRVIRGGSWVSAPAYLRSSFRSSVAASDHRNAIGFRLVRSLER